MKSFPCQQHTYTANAWQHKTNFFLTGEPRPAADHTEMTLTPFGVSAGSSSAPCRPGLPTLAVGRFSSWQLRLLEVCEQLLCLEAPMSPSSRRSSTSGFHTASSGHLQSTLLPGPSGWVCHQRPRLRTASRRQCQLPTACPHPRPCHSVDHIPSGNPKRAPASTWRPQPANSPMKSRASALLPTVPEWSQPPPKHWQPVKSQLLGWIWLLFSKGQSGESRCTAWIAPPKSSDWQRPLPDHPENVLEAFLQMTHRKLPLQSSPTCHIPSARTWSSQVGGLDPPESSAPWVPMGHSLLPVVESWRLQKRGLPGTDAPSSSTALWWFQSISSHWVVRDTVVVSMISMVGPAAAPHRSPSASRQCHSPTVSRSVHRILSSHQDVSILQNWTKHWVSHALPVDGQDVQSDAHHPHELPKGLEVGNLVQKRRKRQDKVSSPGPQWTRRLSWSDDTKDVVILPIQILPFSF